MKQVTEQQKLNGIHVSQSGTITWYRDGKKHRKNGSAVIRSSGIQEYWIHGHRVAGIRNTGSAFDWGSRLMKNISMKYICP